MNNAQLINQDSGNVEYYTDPKITAAARAVMGSIDLDPASCAFANKSIKASTIFTKDDDGLSKSWFGNVWMNHPFSRGERACPEDHSKCRKKICTDPTYKHYRGYHIVKDIPSNGQWIDKLLREFEQGRVQLALNITFGSTSEVWFQKLADYPQCLLSPRTNYYNDKGEVVRGITKGSVVTFLTHGEKLEEFNQHFGPMGKIQLPYRMRFAA